MVKKIADLLSLYTFKYIMKKKLIIFHFNAIKDKTM